MSSWRRFSLSWIEQQGLYSTCPLRFQPPHHLLSCIGCLLRQELNLKYVSLLLKLWSLTSHPILRNFCPFPPTNPPWVWEVQMTLTVYMNLELLKRGDLPIAFSYIAPRLYNRLQITIKLINSLNTFKSHLKAFLFSHAYDQSSLTVQEDYALQIFGVFLLIVFLFISFFSSACEFQHIERIGAHGKQNSDFIIIIIIKKMNKSRKSWWAKAKQELFC